MSGIWSLLPANYNECWMRQREWSVARGRSTVVWRSYTTRRSSLAWARQVQTLHDDVPMPGQHCSTVSDTTLGTSLWDCVTTASSFECQPSTDSSATSAGSHTVVGRSLSSVRRRGTHCRNVYATLLTVLLFLAVFLKHFSSQSTNVYSALEPLEWMLYINRSFTLYHITLSHGRSSPLINFSSQSTSSFLEMHFRSSLRQLSTHNKKNNAWSFINNKATHTHTRLTALFPGLPGWAGTRKVKPIWILLKQEIVSGSGISWAICKSTPRLDPDR